jgi:hypothetical protein
VRPKLVLSVALLFVPVLLAACGGGGSDSASKNTPGASDATYQAAVDEAEQTPVSDSMRTYTKQLCKPLATFLTKVGSIEAEMTAEPTPEGTVSLEDAFTTGFAEFGELKDPIKDLTDALRGIDPPQDLKSYHEDLIAEMDYASKAIDAIDKNGLAGALALPTEEATPQEPEGFNSGLIQECNEDLRPLLDRYGFDLLGNGIFSGSGSDKTPTPKTGSIGQSITSGKFELTVHSFNAHYESNDEFYQPTPGNRYVVVDLSLKNVSGESQDYTSFDFKLKDSDNFEYDSMYVGADHELDGGTLTAGETIRGTASFELPVDTSPATFSFQPGFFGEGRIDVRLR